MIAGIASFCGSVKSGNLSLNQFLTGGVSRSRSISRDAGCSRYVNSGMIHTSNADGVDRM